MKYFIFLCSFVLFSSACRAVEVNSGEVKSRYRIGMSLEEVKKFISKDYEANSTGIELSDEEYTREQKKKEVRYIMNIEDEKLVLFFNWFREVIDIKPFSPTVEVNEKK